MLYGKPFGPGRQTAWEFSGPTKLGMLIAYADIQPELLQRGRQDSRSMVNIEHLLHTSPTILFQRSQRPQSTENVSPLPESFPPNQNPNTLFQRPPLQNSWEMLSPLPELPIPPTG